MTGEVCVFREIRYYGTANIEERSEIDSKWEVTGFTSFQMEMSIQEIVMMNKKTRMFFIIGITILKQLSLSSKELYL